MNADNQLKQLVSEIESVEVEHRKGISMVWLLPIVAALIAGWLGYKAYTEKGPTVTISFKEATGIEAGKTKIKYKDIELGTVTDVALSEDLSEVLITAEFGREAAKHLNHGTRFWVVRPRVGASGISGLGTLFSGAYIEIEPGEGASQQHFTGLDEPPVVANDVPGREFTLQTDDLGSLHAGAPIYYRGLHAGEVLDYLFSPDSGQISLQAFVEAPFDRLVKQNTRFWNISGVEVQAGADGFDIKTGSLQSILAGGIAFDSFGDQSQKTSVAEAGASFRLYTSFSDSFEQTFDLKIPYVMFFNGSVRGLQIGAPVEFRGIKIGRVTDINIVEDADSLEIYIPVTVEIEPERVSSLNGQHTDKSAEEIIAYLVERGLKAQLQTGSLLTGQLYVDMEFHPAIETRLSGINYTHPELPTIPTTFDEIEESVKQLVAEVKKLPIDDIAQIILQTTQGLNRLVNDPELRNVALSADATLLQAERTLAEMQATMSTIDEVVAPDSALQYDLANMVVEIKSAAQSIRALTTYLERHPEALIAGKN